MVIEFILSIISYFIITLFLLFDFSHKLELPGPLSPKFSYVLYSAIIISIIAGYYFTVYYEMPLIASILIIAPWIIKFLA